MTQKRYNVLFLCTGNSARSIFAEAILNRLGKGRFRAFSAGSHPTGEVQTSALELLKRFNFSIEGLRSKSWDEFTAPAAPPLDFVFTVCARAAAEVCPVWPGQAMTGHWWVADPTEVQGSELERMQAFSTAFRELEDRINVFVNLPFGSLERLKLQQRLDEIGRARTGSAVQSPDSAASA